MSQRDANYPSRGASDFRVAGGNAACLDAFPVIRSRDPEAVSAALESVFGVRGFDIADSDREFEICANHWQGGAIGISYCGYGTGVRAVFPAAGFVRQQFCLQGGAEIFLGRSATTVTSAETHVIPVDQKIDARFGEGFEQFVLRIDDATLTRTATALNGSAPSRPLLFGPRAHADSPAQKRLRRLLGFLVAELDAEPDLPTLDELEQAIIVSFLHANPNNYYSFDEDRPRSADSWVVRRVEEFIEANWANAVTLEDLLRVTAVSARTIFYQFRRTRGYSPFEFLRRVRLRQARRILSAREERTVTDTALACGFVNLGHFARAYSSYFGELPSETMRRAERGEKTKTEGARYV